jgi:hypothetical protein
MVPQTALSTQVQKIKAVVHIVPQDIFARHVSDIKLFFDQIYKPGEYTTNESLNIMQDELIVTLAQTQQLIAYYELAEQVELAEFAVLNIKTLA